MAIRDSVKGTCARMFASRSMRGQDSAGVSPCGDGRYRMVSVVMSRQSVKAMRESRMLEGDGPPPALKPGTPLVLALPRREVIVKTLRVPSTDRRQVGQMAPYEAAAQLPWTPGESQVAFDIHESNEPEYSDLVLYMCRKDTIQGHLTALKKWGLTPSRIEAAFVSAGRLAWRSDAESPAILVVDGNGIEYARYKCGRAVFTRGTSGDEPPTDVLARSMQIDARLNGHSGDGLCSGVYVAGDAAPDLPELARAARGNVPVRPVADLTPAVPASAADAVCMGAALGGSEYIEGAPPGGNLLPEREMRRVVLRHIFRQGRVLAVAAVWLIAVLGGLAYFFFSRELARVTRAEARIAAIRSEVGNLKEQNDALELLAGERVRVSVPLLAILELYRVTPQTVAISAFAYDSKRTLAFGGEAPSFRVAYEYMDALLVSKMFGDIEMRHATKPQPGKQETVEFKVTCVIREGA